jgi:hypothetical protein
MVAGTGVVVVVDGGVMDCCNISKTYNKSGHKLAERKNKK